MGKDNLKKPSERDRLRIKILKIIIYKNRINEHKQSIREAELSMKEYAARSDMPLLKYDEDNFEMKKIKKRKNKIIKSQGWQLYF